MMNPENKPGKARRRVHVSKDQATPLPNKRHILIVEDEHDIQDILRYNFEREGYQVTTTDHGEDAIELAKAHLPDLVLLDLMLPGIDGLEVCRLLRAESTTATLPVIMLTAKGEEADIVTGLELGADDYMTKPFSPRILIARVKAVLRRVEKKGTEKEAEVIRVGELVLDSVRHEARISGEAVELTLTEFRIAQTLARRQGRVFTRNQIVDMVQGDRVVVTDRSVDVHIVSLRRKLGTTGRYIQTVRGVGYRLEEV